MEVKTNSIGLQEIVKLHKLKRSLKLKLKKELVISEISILSFVKVYAMKKLEEELIIISVKIQIKGQNHTKLDMNQLIDNK